MIKVLCWCRSSNSACLSLSHSLFPVSLTKQRALHACFPSTLHCSVVHLSLLHLCKCTREVSSVNPSCWQVVCSCSALYSGKPLADCYWFFLRWQTSWKITQLGRFVFFFFLLLQSNRLEKKKKKAGGICLSPLFAETDRVAVWNKGDASLSITLHQHYLPGLPVALYSTSPCQVGDWRTTRG